MLLARVTAIPPHYWEQYILCPFGMHQHTAVSLRRVEAVKQDRLGWDFLVNTCVRKLKEKHDDNKEVYSVDTIYNSARHNNVIVNIKVYNLK